MKKILGFIALAVLVALPLKANAATYSISPVEGTVTPDTNGNFVVTLKATQSGGTAFTAGTTYTANMTLTNVEYVSYEAANGFAISVSGNTITMIAGQTVEDAEFTVAKLTFRKTGNAGDECGVSIECNGVTKKITNTTPKNPKTGNALPYVVIISGAAIAGAVYYVTRRNTKFYRI